jgi:hypothetical protein
MSQFSGLPLVLHDYLSRVTVSQLRRDYDAWIAARVACHV